MAEAGVYRGGSKKTGSKGLAHNVAKMSNVLLRVCAVNLSKMPGHTTSSNGKRKDAFRDHWADIFEEQVKCYDPNVIIFGNTFSEVEKIFLTDGNSPEPVWAPDKKPNKYYTKDDRLLVDAYHPGMRKSEYWVDPIIDTLKEYQSLQRKEKESR